MAEIFSVETHPRNRFTHCLGMDAKITQFLVPPDRVAVASPEIADLLRLNGLRSLSCLEARRESAPSRHAGRCVWSMPLRTPSGDQCRVFVKMQWGRTRLYPRPADVIAGQARQTAPEREWHGLRLLRQIGLSTARPLALFSRRGWRVQTACLIEAIPVETSLLQIIRDGRWFQLAAEERSALIDAMAEVLHRIHAAKLAWRGVSTKHLFPQRLEQGWRLWLIDCEGVHRRFSRAPVRRDHRRLLRSLQCSGADSSSLHQLAERLYA